MNKKITALAGLALVAGILLTGCTSSEYEARKQLQKQTAQSESLELSNLQEKLSREDDPTAIRYIYLMNFGQIVGYYVAEGKISSNGSQVAPEQEIICRSSAESCQAVDSSQDDGSYGAGDPGIFFFTSEGVMVVTSLDYIQSDAPIPIDVPRLEN